MENKEPLNTPNMFTGVWKYVQSVWNKCVFVNGNSSPLLVHFNLPMFILRSRGFLFVI